MYLRLRQSSEFALGKLHFTQAKKDFSKRGLVNENIHYEIWLSICVNE